MNRTNKTTYYPGSYDADDHRGASWGETLRANPIPLAMIGLGVGWMLLSGTGYDRRIAHSSTMRSVRERAYGAAGSVRQAAEHAYDRAGESLHHAGDRVGGAMQRARGAAGRMGDQMGGHESAGRARSMASGFWDMVDDHPLVAGVLGVAMGAALGASIPSTRYEDRWVGDYADEAYDRARSYAEDAIDRGTRAAKAAVETAREDVKEAVGDMKDAAKNVVNDSKQAAKEEAKKSS
ncbi:hypothetical protein [Azospirillum sp. ST 5-10]|uniref:hypothetical protein n=1 Tax=unclassified Azospirillum TaxID=2630922 RepID=UPI003F4A332F